MIIDAASITEDNSVIFSLEVGQFVDIRPHMGIHTEIPSIPFFDLMHSGSGDLLRFFVGGCMDEGGIHHGATFQQQPFLFQLIVDCVPVTPEK